jgi:hypothetical protein
MPPKTKKHCGMDIEKPKPKPKRRGTAARDKMFVRQTLRGFARDAGIRRLPQEVIDELTPLLKSFVDVLVEKFFYYK